MTFINKIINFFKTEKKNSKLIATEELVYKNIKTKDIIDTKVFISAEKDLKKSLKEKKKIESKSISDRDELSKLGSQAIFNTFKTHKNN